MGPFSISAIAALTSALVTTVGLVLAWHAAKIKEYLSAFDFKREWSRDVRAWASDSIEILSRAIYCFDQPDAEAVIHECRARISALVESGRFLFPNVKQDQHGQKKLPAYQGYRHSVLDPLIAAIKVMDGNVGAFESPAAALRQMRRHFVSEVFEILDASQHNKELQKLIEKAHLFEKEARKQRNLKSSEEIPQGANPLLYPRKISD